MIGPEDSLMAKQLHVDVHREDGSYWAEVRELPGCFASGATVAELLASKSGTIPSWSTSARISSSDGEPVDMAAEAASRVARSRRASLDVLRNMPGRAKTDRPLQAA